MKPEDRRDDRPGDVFADIPDPAFRSASQPLSSMTPGGASLTRRQLGRRRTVALAAAALWPVAIVGAWGLRQRESVDTGSMALQGALWIVLIVLAAFVAFSRGKRGLGRPVRWAEWVVGGGLLSFLFIALLWIPARAVIGFAAVGPASLLQPCIGLGLFAAVPMLMVASWPLRHAMVQGAGWRGATVGAAAGFGAVLVLTLHCPSAFGGHVVLAHGAPLVIATLAGAFIGARIGRA
jgi:Negative regulator of sigma F